MDLPGPLVDAEWLAAHRSREELVVADVRWAPGGGPADVSAAFAARHIPGAALVDVDRDLAAEPGVGGRHPLPEPAAFSASMGRAGIGDASVVVAVDDAGGSLAARLWWMLDAVGHPAAVLDGGTRSWNGPWATGPPTTRRATFTSRPWPPDAIVDADGVRALLRAGEAVVLDARAGERYRGEAEPIDPVAGHVPGAVSAPWSANLDPATGRFRHPSELRRQYEALGAAHGGVAMCGSGVTACHDLLAMRVAGIDRTRLFAGSWSGWIADASRPVALGSEPGQPV
jgi:thiosulfate/3-mercaptopyruvate sulfurtransferase